MPAVDKRGEALACRRVIELNGENFSQIPQLNLRTGPIEATMPRDQVLILAILAPQVTRSRKVCVDLEFDHGLEWLHACVKCSHVEVFARLEEHLGLSLQPAHLGDHIARYLALKQ